MGIEDLINLALLALVIGISTMTKGCRKLLEAELLAMKVRRSLEDCERARLELQEFAVLFNYGAIEEAYEHFRACGFKTGERARPQRST